MCCSKFHDLLIIKRLMINKSGDFEFCEAPWQSQVLGLLGNYEDCVLSASGRSKGNEKGEEKGKLEVKLW